ncbi:MAG: PEP-CTERM sorting domain-containing protein [Acidobacteria bacterium]|nr:PEP-CTERM sorting domain-containing protein [Acidobacteriota bacterium]
MNRLLVVFATLLLAVPAFSAVLVDWETPPFTVNANGSINGSSADPGFDNPLVTLGVDITGDANTLNLRVITGEPAPIPWGSNYLLVHTVGNNAASPSVVTIDFQRNGSTWFAQGNTISIDLWDTNTIPDPRITLVAYDDMGNIAETIGFSPVSGDTGTVSFTTASLISRVEITDAGGDGYIADNLNFNLENTAAVPEPGSVALVGGGLLLVGLLRRRR